MSSLRALILQHVPFAGPGCISDWLSARSATTITRQPSASDALPTLDDIDLLILLDGPLSINDAWFHDWIPAEQDFLARAIAQDKAVLGIGFGAQLIASALGARVVPAAQREIGCFDIEGIQPPDDTDEVFRFPARSTVLHWHDECFELPAQARLLARSEACENQAFQLGRRVIGLQFRLETTPASLDAWLETCGEELEPERWVQDEASLRADHDRFAPQNNQQMNAVLEYLTASLK